jgi:hypothetical protein
MTINENRPWRLGAAEFDIKAVQTSVDNRGVELDGTKSFLALLCAQATEHRLAFQAV